MVKVRTETIFPASRKELWRVLERHLDDAAIVEIHPFIRSSKRAAPNEGVRAFERVWHLYGRTFSVTTKYETAPMEMFRWEITASTGGFAPGSYIENHYSEVSEEKTRIETRGELTLRGVPRFLQGWIVHRGLNQSDGEDLRYLLKTRA